MHACTHARQHNATKNPIDRVGMCVLVGMASSLISDTNALLPCVHALCEYVFTLFERHARAREQQQQMAATAASYITEQTRTPGNGPGQQKTRLHRQRPLHMVVWCACCYLIKHRIHANKRCAHTNTNTWE